MHRSQAALLLLQVAHFFGPEETSFEVQEVSWLLWTGVFRGAAPVVQAVLPTLMLPKRSRHWPRALGQRENGSLGIGME